MLNEWLIGQGIARTDPAADHELVAWFTKLEGQAKARNRGRWTDPAAD